MSDEAKAKLVDPPRGAHQARVDEKGRLKLPNLFVKYLDDLGEKTVFITSIEGTTARLYPLQVWKENEKLLNESTEPSAASVAWMANHFGADSDVDSNGRVLVPTELRRHLKIENETVWLNASKGRINIVSRTEYEKQTAIAMANIVPDLKVMEQRGFK